MTVWRGESDPESLDGLGSQIIHAIHALGGHSPDVWEVPAERWSALRAELENRRNGVLSGLKSGRCNFVFVGVEIVPAC